MNRLTAWLKGPSPRNSLARNTWRLYQDLLWLGLASAASTYISVYAIRLGASDQMIGLLSSVPALLVLMLRIPAARWMERTSDRQGLIVRFLNIGRSLYFVIFLLPWLGLLPLITEIPQGTLLIILVLLMGLPSAVTQAGWDSFFADVVPEGQRAKVVSVRSMMSGILMLTAVPVFGLWLDWAPFPFNYQVVFLLAFAGAMVSTWHVSKINVPDTATKPNKAATALTFRETRRILGENKEFAALVLGTFVYQWSISLASPLFNIYYVDHLSASDSWIGWRTTLASLTSIIAYRIWPRQIDKKGARAIITLSAPLMALFPFVTGLTRTLTPNMFIVIWPQLFGAGVMLARYSILLRACPDDRRPTYIAIYAMVANIAAFLAPMAGVELMDLLGINAVFFIAAVFRLAAGLLYFRLPKTPDGTPASGRVTAEQVAPASETT